MCIVLKMQNWTFHLVNRQQFLPQVVSSWYLQGWHHFASHTLCHLIHFSRMVRTWFKWTEGYTYSLQLQNQVLEKWIKWHRVRVQLWLMFILFALKYLNMLFFFAIPYIVSWHLLGHAIKSVICFDLLFSRSTRPMTLFCIFITYIDAEAVF